MNRQQQLRRHGGGCGLQEVSNGAEMIEGFLGNPKTDPHGDPIPSLNGEIFNDSSQILLSKASVGIEYEISRLFSSDEEFFEFCNANHILIGSTLKVEKQYDSKKMTEITIHQNKMILNEDFTSFIYVKQVNTI